MMSPKIGIIGAGKWGTALGRVCCEGRASGVTMWSRDNTVLPEVFPQTTVYPSCTNNLRDLADCNCLFITIPVIHVRSILEELKSLSLFEHVPLVFCCKGIESGTNYLMSEIAEDVMPSCPVMVISGPNLAHEISAGMAASTIVACEDASLGNWLVNIISGENFRAHYTCDIISTQICGSVKNVLAIASGIMYGAGAGENAIASLLACGLVEVVSLCSLKGGSIDVVYGLAGIGDLMLTCYSKESRNTMLGTKLASGLSLQDIVERANSTFEGINTALSVKQLADKYGINLPVCETVYKILYEKMPIDTALLRLKTLM